ncbi:mycothiol transferase [Lysinibacter cavernae]|uniref:Putative damage-inducible protein DinB n=1 Tax=Lysinibacter cavernae TaxID=1640652 RepID=A0A7X5R3F8_9MICO|nr:DUF664 domain-containing protein [Lysinibacter cavernae]NIH54822.1 putative damage-inducible protein DinB [Lysinibacter cavernae]
MTAASELLVDSFNRIREVVEHTVNRLDSNELAVRPAGTGNSIAWLIWHLTRVQDSHVADAAGTEQVWTAAGWAKRFGLPFTDEETGYGMTSDEVELVRDLTAEQLAGYHAEVNERTVAYVSGLKASAFDQVVDTRWDPPVTLGVRLVSVIADDLQHAGQAAYVKGLLPKR